ncbi:MAG: winged helix-turn-helix transcriptional regulator [Candidatus Omnitrophica bacterium]|nr:winged helix-turn-helix transcriptional regulator [Candidatus Omnitrophota bacterium]
MEYKNKKIDIKVLQDAARMLKSVAHPLKLRIIEALESNQRMSVSELMSWLKEDQVPVSKALGSLKKAGILKSATQGNLRVYQIEYKNVFNLLNCIRMHKKG